ncbi:MAG: DUF1569 domain-containing protein [Phycisphaerae bacterium]
MSTEPTPPDSLPAGSSPVRRALRFACMDDALAEARRCAAADEAGTLHRAGNWTCGQILGHLAWWIDAPYDDLEPRPPLWLRLVARLMKKRILHNPSPPNFKLPGVPGGSYGTDDMPTAQGLVRYEKAAARLLAAPPEEPNPAFGPMTHDEWKLLHIRHAEVHLGCLLPSGIPEETHHG